MQSKLIQELYRQTESLVAELFPQSKLLKLDNFPSFWRVWQLNSGDNLKMYLILAPSPKDDSFAFEIAWSIHGVLPEFDGRHPDEDQGKGKMRFRLSQFWQRYGAEHCWYFDGVLGTQELMIPATDAPLEAKLESVAPQLGDVFAKLRQYGVPYLKSIAALYKVGFQVKE